MAKRIIILVLIGIVLPILGSVVRQISDLSGKIKSPNYPNAYPNSQDIAWKFAVNAGHKVVLQFEEFSLDDSGREIGSCERDFVEVTESGRSGRRYCGSSATNGNKAPELNKDFEFREESLTIRFVSDANGTPASKGFVVNYTIFDRDECREKELEVQTAYEDWDELIYCNHNCHNVVGSYYCSCDEGFHLHSNKHTCTSNCAGIVVTNESGKITSSRYPDAYSKLANCDWTIQAKEGISIELRFTNMFSIEEHYEEGCVFDWLQYQMNGKSSQKYCGKTKPNEGNWIQTNTDEVKVIFVTDLTEEEAGFELEYKFKRVACKEKVTAPVNGAIVSSKQDQFVFEDEVNFTCNKGFRVTGARYIKCQKDGRWSAKVPRCEAIVCQPPVHITGIKNVEKVTLPSSLAYGAIISVTCKKDWYELTSGASGWICGDEALWHVHSGLVAPNTNDNIPECSPVCGLKGNKRVSQGGIFKRAAPHETFRFGPSGPGAVVAVIGGHPVKVPNEWPWMAFIDLFGRGLRASEFCGGTLVSTKTVITAAHCTERTYRSSIRVFIGASNRFSTRGQNIQQFSVSELYQHENYSEATFDNDIAILILSAPVKIGLEARPICLPRSQREKALPDLARTEETHQKTGVLAGWGITEHGTLPLTLNSARIEPMEQETCVRLFEKNKPRSFGDIKITDNMLCAGYPGNAKNRDSCQGDSGGPLMFREPIRSRYFLNGVVSFGSTEECGGGTFGIYARVSEYIAWIDNRMVE